MNIKIDKKKYKFNDLILQEADKISKATNCSAIFFFSDTFIKDISLNNILSKQRIILVTQSSKKIFKKKQPVILVKSFTNNRFSQLKSAILIGLTRKIIKRNDRLCCIAGLPNNNQLDSIIIIDINREFYSNFTKKTDIFPANIQPEVIERALSIAIELAVEGREGRSVGCLFVLGGTKKIIKNHTKPLILNPFRGYQKKNRNILNPFIHETIKELSSIDGGFIIKGNGVIQSAGTLLIIDSNYYNQLLSGLGARHSAALAISKAFAECMAIVVSSSTRQVTLFRKGKMFPLIDKTTNCF